MNIQYQSEQLALENIEFEGTGGVSQENCHLNFKPAFMDEISGIVEVSRFKNGMLAPFHSLEGLPDHWITERDESGRVVQIKSSIVSGFVRMETFFTRQEASDFFD